LLPTTLLQLRLASAGLVLLHPSTAAGLNLAAGQKAAMLIDGTSNTVMIGLDAAVPEGVVLSPRSVGLPVGVPVKVRFTPLD
jgi:dUTPase